MEKRVRKGNRAGLTYKTFAVKYQGETSLNNEQILNQ
jgi:hypothetical protein